MSKPLELTVYPMAHSDGGTYYADGESSRKRLMDAELAAEYYAQDAKCRHEQWIETVRGDDDYEDWERVAQSRMYEQLTAIHRFGTLPHYDEATK